MEVPMHLPSFQQVVREYARRYYLVSSQCPLVKSAGLDYQYAAQAALYEIPSEARELAPSRRAVPQ